MIFPKELAKICKEVESMRLFEDIKEKEPQTKMILELQKVLGRRSSIVIFTNLLVTQCLAMYPKGPQQYVPPKYLDITEDRMRNYKKILHQSQWEVQSKLMVIKVRIERVFIYSFSSCFPVFMYL